MLRKRKTRRCLKCNEPFVSEGFHLRKCDRCKKLEIEFPIYDFERVPVLEPIEVEVEDTSDV